MTTAPALPNFDVLTQLVEPDYLENPYPLYTWVRENVPVHSHPGGFYIISKHEHMTWLFETPQLRAPDRDELLQVYDRAPRFRCLQLLLDLFVMRSPEEHSRQRRLISRDFTARSVQALLPSMEAICDRLLSALEEPLGDGETVDLHNQFSIPFTVDVLGGLLGVPPADRAAMWPLVMQVINVWNPTATDEVLAEADVATRQIEEYFTQLFVELRKTPGDDLLSTLLVKRDDGDQLTDDELMSTAWALWMAGFETSASGVNNALFAMLEHRDQAHWLGGGSASVRSWVNETLRYDSAAVFSAVPRITTENVVLDDVMIPAGTDVRGLIGAANRDPAAFDQPERFDPTRTNNGTMMTFGRGAHYCLGVALTRIEIETALSGLYARFPNLTVNGTVQRRLTPTLRTFDSVPVAVERERTA